MKELEEEIRKAEQEVLTQQQEIIPAEESIKQLNNGWWVVYSPQKPVYKSGGYQNIHNLTNFFAVMNFFPEEHPRGLYGTCHKGSRAITIANHTRANIKEREKTKMHEKIHEIMGLPDDYAITQLEAAVVGEGWPKSPYYKGGENY